MLPTGLGAHGRDGPHTPLKVDFGSGRSEHLANSQAKQELQIEGVANGLAREAQITVIDR